MLTGIVEFIESLWGLLTSGVEGVWGALGDLLS